VLDHRLNTRTVKMNVVHEEIKHDCAPVYPSIWAAYKEIVPAILRQLMDQEQLRAPRAAARRAPFNEPTPRTMAARCR
jgi:hypothetical protein